MLNHLHLRATLLGSLFLCFSTFVNAGDLLYEQDFESGTMPVAIANPVWQLNISPGQGKLFDVVKDTAHTGQYSLRFNYDGLNGFCNTCGFTARTNKAGNDNGSYFTDAAGSDLTQDPILAAKDRFVFNMNGFSKWRILSIQNKDTLNDGLSLENILNGVDGTPAQFNSGDTALILRVCGVDGTIGGDINRRSDCDRAISYFGGVSQKAGESIYRRLYFMIDKNATLPIVQKLRYWVPTEGSLYVTVNKDSTNPAPYLQIGGVIPGMPRIVRPEGALVEPGIWYYLEEEFKAETALGANDGEYRLWFSKSGEETDTPIIEWVEIGLKPVARASFWGNHQHFEDSHGYWYIDDFKIGSVRAGPAGGSPPLPPTVTMQQ